MITLGSRVGGYTIVQQLGQGGMGQVFLAQHQRIARRAAVKVLLPELSARKDVVERFFTEARATSLIRHPGIVDVLDCDVQDGQAFIVMEALDGESLASYFARTGGLGDDLPFALAVVGQVALAVGTAHGAGIVHRDLKPDNIFLSMGGGRELPVVKVLDFGIAKLMERQSSTQTRTGALLGTPMYMSPEQCRGGSKVIDGRADIYSLGCILYEALAGRPPFVRDGMGDLIVAHVSEAPEALRDIAPTIPPAVDALVARMLSKRPEDRPARMDLVAGELTICLTTLGVSEAFSEISPRSPVIVPASVGESPSKSARAVAPTTPFPTPFVDSASSRKPAPIGGTRLLPQAERPLGTWAPTASASTTFGESVGENRKSASTEQRKTLRLAVLLGIAAVTGGLTLFAFTNHRGPTADASRGGATPIPAALPTPGAATAEDKISIDVEGLPPNAAVFFDGRPREDRPLKIARDDRHHRLSVRAPGDAERSIDIDASRDSVVDLALVPAAGKSTDGRKEEPAHRHEDRRGHANARPRRSEPPVAQPSAADSPPREPAPKPVQTRPPRSAYDDM